MGQVGFADKHRPGILRFNGYLGKPWAVEGRWKEPMAPGTIGCMAGKDLPILIFTAVRALEKYMSDQPRASKGFWLKLAKAGAPKSTISKSEAIEAALCCGWIDGQLGPFDTHYFLVRMTPRRPGSRWSEKNRGIAERLVEQGRVGPAGLAEIRVAKSDGRWDAAYLSQGKADLPEDLVVALTANKAAKGFFEAVDRANRYAIIYRVNDAKRPETRARRIAQFVEMLARGETIHPLKASKGRSVKPKS